MNKVLKNKSRHIGFIIWILVFSACTEKFAGYNTNPVEPTDEMLKKDFLYIGGFFPQMQKNVLPDEAHHYQRAQNLAGDIYSGYFGATNNWFSERNNTVYSMVDEWNTSMFTTSFTRVMPSWKQIKDRLGDDNPSVFAVAQIIKIAALHRAADYYGPLPYLEFGKSFLNTPYDSQEAIYKSFFEELAEAVNTLTEFVSQSPDAKPLKDFDLVYSGDCSKWIKFANSLRLRLAMRVVYVDEALAKTNAEAAVNDGVLTDNADNTILKSGKGIIISNPLKMIWDDFKDTRMGANMESFLNGYGDPRIAKYFRVNGSGQYKGVRNGINFGTNMETYRGNLFSVPNIEASTPIRWMSASEMYFLRAEGALRGWDMGGTAKELYEQGIETSFAQWGAGNADTYKNNSDSLPAAYIDPAESYWDRKNSIPKGDHRLSTIKIAWDDNDSFERKLERIITQKWIAGYPDGHEAWSEFRRTGYPKVFPVVENHSNGTIDTDIQIRRIPFPAGEYQTNPEIMKKAVELLNGPDTGGTRLWWDKKNVN